jgi:CBS domain-containing protein
MQTVQRLHRSGVGIGPDRTIVEAAQVMERSGIGLLAIVDDGELVGVVTDRDLVRRGIAAGLDPDARIDAVMSSPVLTVDADSDLVEAYTTFGRHSVRRLAVVSGSRFVGVLSVDDLLVDLAANLTDLTAPLVAEIDAPHRERPPLVHAAP